MAKKIVGKSLKEALQGKGKHLIAEIKRASPSKGRIGKIPDPAARALFYETSGASAISVLTSAQFEGSLADLDIVHKAVSIPVLRKDFILTEKDLEETTSNAVLLIVSYLGQKTASMLARARRLGLEAIVEVHSEEELQIALDAKADIIGVNQRDLRDFSMHPEVYQLIDKIPPHIVKIAESGVKSCADANRLFAMGYDAVLVGEALTIDPSLCQTIAAQGRLYVH
jgi:indole-3-glycerol phosphate synthase